MKYSIVTAIWYIWIMGSPAHGCSTVSYHAGGFAADRVNCWCWLGRYRVNYYWWLGFVALRKSTGTDFATKLAAFWAYYWLG